MYTEQLYNTEKNSCMTNTEVIHNRYTVGTQKSTQLVQSRNTEDVYIEQLYNKHGEDAQQVQSRYTQKLRNWYRAETQKMYIEQLSNKHRENTQQVQSRYTKKYTTGRARTEDVYRTVVQQTQRKYTTGTK